MSESVIGLAVGVPLAVASVVIAWIVVRAVIQSAGTPGMSPTVIPVTLIVGTALVLFASDPERLGPLSDLAGVGLGGLVGLLVGYRDGYRVLPPPPPPTRPDPPDQAIAPDDAKTVDTKSEEPPPPADG